jgi:N-methylhydantoinase A/oxoprolinase/acetone carboxylase beta subunit
MGHRIGVDIGGTFTDCVVVDEAGHRSVAKSPTTHGSLTDGVLAAVAVNAEQLGLSTRELLASTELFVHGTTVATNAVLTRRGARTGLITTRGHEDAIIIGKVFAKRAGLGQREVIHTSRLRKPEPIVPRELIRGVSERLDVDGDVVVPLQEDEVVEAIDSLVAAGIEALAVSLLWSFVNPSHERRVKEIVAERAPGMFVTFSHELAPVLGEYERTATTALNAYVGPEVVGYLERLEAELRAEGLGPPILVMQANGGLTSVGEAARKPILTFDSGPAGGILGCQRLGETHGEPNLIATDVGGTSFDVGLVLDGEIPLDPAPVIAQYVTRIPKVSVHSIGAGGGSIAWIDEAGLLRVGPQSAGSRPGPAAYALGGEQPTVTDADLVLGYLDPEGFLGGRMRLRLDLAYRALERVAVPLGMEPEEAAAGIFRIVNAQMADLIRTSTIEQGHDPRTCSLVAYGGAGPTHAVFYGQDIGSRAILVPADSSTFSAEGMLACDVVHEAEASNERPAPFDADDLAGIAAQFVALEADIAAQFDREGTPVSDVSVTRLAALRYRLQVHTLEVPVEAGAFDAAAAERVLERFRVRYAGVYGQGAVVVGGGIELVGQRVTGRRALPAVPAAPAEEAGDDAAAVVAGTRRVHFEPGGFVETPAYDGRSLRPGHVVGGPAIVQRMGDSVVVPPGYVAEVDGHRTLRVVRTPVPELAATPLLEAA